ncbi:hypothetical protein LOTGIDRAFT_237232 [Lottia gigantea]|uniref:Hint domain-containing protein n=1 Tax=Lottia gigantea TaxID=225164 RepID=V3YVF4_LOTGI|nr:hypothetical protein LOTGIDRAFT_237232 [Lottia gigantea]ESO81943.1 hypothetical protein LOTGIDRAFT_237232 [Lottia gigantea]
MVNNSGGCFPAHSVITSKLKKYLEDLKEGDKVLAWNDKGDLEFTEVWARTHHVINEKSDYIQLETTTKRLVLSHRHYVLVKTGEEKSEFKMAKDVQIGETLITMADDKTVIEEPVVNIDEVEEEGIYNVFTKSGRIIVNGIFCSTYAEVEPNLVHKTMAPFRTAYDLAPKCVMKKIMTPNKEGKPHLFKIGGDILKPIVSSVQN